MAISGSYFLNGPSLSASTSVYSDIDLSVLAPDGFYSDGIVSREQSSGILLPPVICNCVPIPCSSYTVGTSASSAQLVTWIDCNDVPQEDFIGGVSGFDSISFCAKPNTVVGTNQTTIINNGDCLE